MKKTMLALFGAALLVAVPACKKGVNDPFLSLKSRKARVAGDYVITKIENKTHYDDLNGYVNDVITIYEDGVETKTAVETINGTVNSPDVDVTTITVAEYSFTKDGKWTKTWTYKDNIYEFQTGVSTVKEVKSGTKTTSGVWYFAGKLKGEYKNKERIVMEIREITDNYKKTTTTTVGNVVIDETEDDIIDKESFNVGSDYIVYDIDMLKNKEMIFKYEIEGSLSLSTNQTIDPDKSTTSYTMTLTQK